VSHLSLLPLKGPERAFAETTGISEMGVLRPSARNAILLVTLFRK